MDVFQRNIQNFEEYLSSKYIYFNKLASFNFVLQTGSIGIFPVAAF